MEHADEKNEMIDGWKWKRIRTGEDNYLNNQNK